MNKAELIKIISEESGISRNEANLALESLLENIKNSLFQGERVSLVGFGSWSVANRAAREGRNPQTGQIIRIESKSVIKFKASDFLNKKPKGGTIGGGARRGKLNS